MFALVKHHPPYGGEKDRNNDTVTNLKRHLIVWVGQNSSSQNNCGSCQENGKIATALVEYFPKEAKC